MNITFKQFIFRAFTSLSVYIFFIVFIVGALLLGFSEKYSASAFTVLVMAAVTYALASNKVADIIDPKDFSTFKEFLGYTFKSRSVYFFILVYPVSLILFLLGKIDDSGYNLINMALIPLVLGAKNAGDYIALKQSTPVGK
jgi:hypothetical protein